LKLFVTDYWQNWERERSDVILLALGGILFACIAEVIVRYCERRFGFCAEPSLKKRSSMSSLGVQLEVERGMRNKNGQRWDWWRRIRWKRWALRAYFVSLGIGENDTINNDRIDMALTLAHHSHNVCGQQAGAGFERGQQEGGLPQRHGGK